MSDLILKILPQLVSCGLFGFIAYIVWIIAKLAVTNMICKHPELSNEKVKYITNMMGKNKHLKFN